MCVIMLVEKTRPTEAMLEKAWDINDDGAGFASRDGDEVVWKKGIMEYDEAKELAATLPMPYILHFRNASVNGGGIRPTLTHPFPVEHHASLALEGRTKGYVLFHNGDWKGWEDAVRYASVHGKVKIPIGKWSDTRAMSYLCSIYGLGFMELLPTQRGLAFGPKHYEVFTGPGWTEVNGVWCSKDEFVTRGVTRQFWFTVCDYGNCGRRDIDTTGRCPIHTKPMVRLATGAQGVSQAPFPRATPEAEAKPVIALTLAERWHKDNLMSKNLIKAVRKHYERTRAVDQKTRERAWHVLRDLTQKAIDQRQEALKMNSTGQQG